MPPSNDNAAKSTKLKEGNTFCWERCKLVSLSSGPEGNAVKDLSSCFRRVSGSPFSPSNGEKVADRPDEGVIRCFCRLEILNGVARHGRHIPCRGRDGMLI
jgi:hypothetical protein